MKQRLSKSIFSAIASKNWGQKATATAQQ